MVNKTYYLSEAIKITQEHARGGSVRPAEDVLEEVYKKLLELAGEIRE